MRNGNERKIMPVLIPTLCRYEHLKKCIGSLALNSYAKFVDVYVALDFPVTEKHRKGYDKITEYLYGNFSEFASFTVIKRKHNYGSLDNTYALIDEILEKYDKFIFTEDDNEFAPNFLEYMFKSMNYFENDPKVLAVTGYSYPISYHTNNHGNVIMENAIFNMWGTGFWKSKYLKIKKAIHDEKKLLKDFSNNIKNYQFSEYRRIDYINCAVGSDINDKDVWNNCRMLTNITDMSLGIYMPVSKMYLIMPTISKVRNNGFDGSGVYCQNTKNIDHRKIYADTYDYSKQKIDNDRFFKFEFDGEESKTQIFEDINAFVQPGMKLRIRAGILLAMNTVLGSKMMIRIKKRRKSRL